MIGPQTTSQGSCPTPIPRFAAQDRDADLRNTFFLHAHRHLHETKAEPARAAAKACLATRGFDLRHLDPVPIGLMPTLFSMRASLAQAGFTPEELRASGLVGDARLPGRLVGPIADAAGQIVSFWAWDPAGEEPRCLYSHRDRKRQLGLCGMDVALPATAAGTCNLLVVEEILDALLLHSHGLLHAAAIGGSAREMTPDRWHRLAAMGVHSATLLFGDCPAWGRGTIAAVESVSRAEMAPEIYVLPSDRLPALKGLGDTIHSLGIEVLAGLLERDCIHGYRYKALTLLAKHKQGVSWTDITRQAALEEAMQFCTAAHPNNVPQLNTFFVPPILDELGQEGDGRRAESPWFDETSHDPEVEDTPQEPENVEIPSRQPEAVEVSTDATIARPEPTRRPNTGFCTLHGCDRMKCFCWD